MAKDYDQWYIDIVNAAETPERGIITVRKLMQKREEWEDATAYRRDKKWFYNTGQHDKNKEKAEMANPSEYFDKLSRTASINKIMQAVNSYAMMCKPKIWKAFCKKVLAGEYYVKQGAYSKKKTKVLDNGLNHLLPELRKLILLYIEQDPTIDDDVKEYIKRVSKKNKKSKR